MKTFVPTLLTGSKLALLREYGKAIDELITVIQPISNNDLLTIVDLETNDDDCRSIQTILSHVVCSGFGYIIRIENFIGIKKEMLVRKFYPTVNEYIHDMNLMLQYAITFFQKHPRIELEELDNKKKIKVKCGQYYSIEQLMEHAIVHVLRHRRQIENYMKHLNLN